MKGLDAWVGTSVAPEILSDIASMIVSGSATDLGGSRWPA